MNFQFTSQQKPAFTVETWKVCNISLQDQQLESGQKTGLDLPVTPKLVHGRPPKVPHTNQREWKQGSKDCPPAATLGLVKSAF